MKTRTILCSAAIIAATAFTALAAPAQMAGMAGMQSGAAPTPAPTLTVTLKTNPPVVGDNVLDIVATDATGKPLDGLKLQSSVAMTSMDMGTSHPPVKNMGGGKYRATVNFMMEGPWRVILKGQGVNQALPFNPGSKALWTMPKTAAVSTSPSAASTQATATAPQAPTNVPSAPTPYQPAQPAMSDMKGMADMQGMSDHAQTGAMTHTALSMPQLKATKIVTVSGNEDWNTYAGFGKNAPMVAMMDQMMVGGSPMEGMKMGVMKMDFSDANFTPGASMTGDMAGMQMDSASSAQAGKLTAKLTSAAKVGENAFELTALDQAGKPIANAKIALSVAMTSMDMGTTHPAVKELGNGKYTSTVNFTMVGPWRVNATVTAPSQTLSKGFDFDAK